MNKEQLTAGVRQLILVIGGYFIGKGWVTTEQWAEIAVPAAAIIGTIGWGQWARTTHNQIVSVADKGIVAQVKLKDPKAAAEITSSKVTAGV